MNVTSQNYRLVLTIDMFIPACVEGAKLNVNELKNSLGNEMLMK